MSIPTPPAWEKAAEAFLSPDDFQSLKSLAEAFAEDRKEGVNTALTPAQSDIQQDVELTKFRLEILKRGAGGREIWLHDGAELYGAEMAALSALKRAGLVEFSKSPLPPGPPEFPAYVLTAAGVAAVKAGEKP